MKQNEHITEWIDRYLNGEIEGEELAQFKKQMDNDEDFKMEVAAQKAVRDALFSLGNEKLKQQFKQFHNEIFEDEAEGNISDEIEFEINVGQKKRNLFFFFEKNFKSFAAATIGLVAVGILVYNFQKEKKDAVIAEKIYETYYTKVEKVNENGVGYVQTEPLIDSVVIILIESDTPYLAYKYHRDTLKIYAEKQLKIKDISIIYDGNVSYMRLQMDSVYYRVIKGFDRIMKLEKEM